MEWLNKIPQWVKIPLKILLPSLCIFSGFLLLINDNFAEKLYLLEFRKTNGFAFGIIFIVTLSLILCYTISFIIDRLKIYKVKFDCIKKFNKLDDVYKEILHTIYKRPTKSMHFNVENANITFLTNINAVGHSNISRNGTFLDFYLQPWVIWSIEKEIKTCEKYERFFNKHKKKLKEKPNYSEYEEKYKYCFDFLNWISKPENDDNYDW